jgi:CRISPR-associated protein Csx3
MAGSSRERKRRCAMKPIITIEEKAGYCLVKFEIPGGVTTPEEAAQAVGEIVDQLPGNLPVLINGRGPIWLYAMLVHAAHPTPVVGTYDPRLSGYVVVASHDPHWGIGDTIPDPEA